MNTKRRNLRPLINLVAVCCLLTSTTTSAQVLSGTENGEWRYLGGTAGHIRYSPLDQINRGNFEDLEIAWIWRSDNFGPNVDYFSRSTPIYVDGVLYTVATPRRQVIAMDPATGEVLWTFREPETIRHQRSPRQAYGKGVAYAELDDGRGVIYITTPGFFLWALDAQDRAAPGELGFIVSGGRVSRSRRGGPDSPAGGRLGSLAGLRAGRR